MKKAFAILLIISVLLLCGCNAVSNETEKPTESETVAPTEKATDPKEAYLDIECRQASAYKKLYFGKENSEQAFIISLPNDMELKQTVEGYELLRGGAVVGNIYYGDRSSESGWETVKSQNSDTNGVNKKILVEMGNDSTFRHKVIYDYGDGEKVTLTCDYAELDFEAIRMVAMAARIETVGNPLNLNTLSELKDKKIIILGNSFINSSKIGEIFKAMVTANGKSLDITAISRGYAEVDSYIADETLMAAIKNGEYDGVFICGFYAEEEADHLKVLEDACKVSDTELVIFPAHNEFRNCIEAAQKKCPELKTVDWKGEVDMLIESGIDQWDFCIDDIHKHSKPLAGYVGAQMIYRAIYGEIPAAEVRTQSFNSVDAKALLGDYMNTGKVPVDIEINYFD